MIGMIAKWIGLAACIAACSAAAAWLLIYWPLVFFCVLGSATGLALIAYWVGVFAEHRREREAWSPQREPPATVDGRPVWDVEVIP